MIHRGDDQIEIADMEFCKSKALSVNPLDCEASRGPEWWNLPHGGAVMKLKTSSCGTG